jgi:sulfite exporter TauE/SafE
MTLAGALSGLLGIGSGAVKVLAMDQTMRMPFKVFITTSNFMTGVTAAASAGMYLNRGYIDPGLSMPVMLGVLLGSLLGARVLARSPARLLRIIRHGHFGRSRRAPVQPRRWVSVKRAGHAQDAGAVPREFGEESGKTRQIYPEV